MGRTLSMLRPCILGIVVAPGTVQAGEPQLPFTVEYRPTEGCATAEQFSDQLLARTPRVRRATSGEAALRFRIRFTGSGASLVGQFSVQELDGSETTRFIPNASCSDAVAAMALIATVLIDPSAAVSAAAAAPVTAPSKTKKEPLGPIVGSSPRWQLGAGIGGLMEWTVAPGVAPGLSCEVGAQLQSQRRFSPRASIALAHTLTQTVESERGRAQFEWSALRVTLSPLRLPAKGPFAVRPGVLLDVGRLKGSGARAVLPNSENATWLALGLVARVEASPIRNLAFLLDGGLIAPFRHDSFYFAPEGDEGKVFTVPKVGALARFGFETLY